MNNGEELLKFYDYCDKIIGYARNMQLKAKNTQTILFCCSLIVEYVKKITDYISK